MSEQIGQTGRKKDQKGTVLLKSRIFFFKYQMQKKIQGREASEKNSRNMAIKKEKK